jgi:phage-related protein
MVYDIGVRVLYYATAAGRSPVEAFIREQPARLRAAILDALQAIVDTGIETSGVSFRQVRGKLWEIRIQSGSAARLFYVLRTANEMVLLHAYRKQSQKAPTREIETAERRMKEVLE